MRRAIEGLEASHPLLDGMPSIYHADDFTVRLLSGFDDVLAPVQAVVNDMDAYFDPAICPTDFLEWIGSWIGVPANHRWPLQRRRQMILAAVDVHRLRGTAAGIASAVEFYTGVTPEIFESGGCVASGEPATEFPGDARPSIRVVVRTSRRDVDRDVIDQIVTAAKPAHVQHAVELVTS